MTGRRLPRQQAVPRFENGRAPFAATPQAPRPQAPTERSAPRWAVRPVHAPNSPERRRPAGKRAAGPIDAPPPATGHRHILQAAPQRAASQLQTETLPGNTPQQHAPVLRMKESQHAPVLRMKESQHAPVLRMKESQHAPVLRMKTACCG